MKRNRPTLVLVMGILSIVFGSLGLIFSLCCVGQMVAFHKTAASAGVNVPGADKVASARLETMEREVPNYVALELTHRAFWVLFATILLIGGIGLIFMRNWGRWCCILYALIMPLVQVVGLWWRFTKVTPAEIKARGEAMKAQAEMMKNMGRGAGATPINLDFIGTGMNIAASVVASVIIIYCIALLVTMLQPRVSRAFAGAAAGVEPN